MKSTFEKAVHAIVSGDEKELRNLLKDNPYLIRETSQASHQSTLLHYVSANGVEDEFQKSPQNAVRIAKILLDAGADPDAMPGNFKNEKRYQTPLNYLVSSYHPFAAGVQVPLVEEFILGGAQINGLENDGAPLGTALAFGYRKAAEKLAELGADCNNILFASGLGKLDLVKSFFDENGKLIESHSNFEVAEKTERGRYSWPPPKGKDPLVLAFIYACIHGRNEVIEFLLSKGVDVNCYISFQQTGLHYASQLGYFQTVKLLLENGANPNIIESQFNQTPIEWAEEGNEKEVANYLKSYSKDNQKQFSHSATILIVPDVLKSAEYYRDNLGFSISFLWETPPSYAVMNKENAVNIHFVKSDKDFTLPDNRSVLYVFVFDVDKLHKELSDKGVQISNPIADRDYGMRDFDITDLNGYILTFGTSLEMIK